MLFRQRERAHGEAQRQEASTGEVGGKVGATTGGSRAQVTPLLTGQAEKPDFTPKCRGSRVG